MEQASIDLQTRMTYALCIRIQYISLSSAYSRYRRDSAETSSSTGSRAWTDLNLEQRHDCNAPLRGNFICRPSRPWASSASRGRFENHPIFEVCIVDRWRRPFIIAGDRTLLPNSLPSPPSSTSFLSSILFQLPLSFLRQTRRKRRFDSLFTFPSPCESSRFITRVMLINPWCYVIVFHALKKQLFEGNEIGRIN